MNKISSNHVKDLLTERLNLDTRATILGHTQRGGPACIYDRWLSTLQGVYAVKTILEATPESPSYIINIHENKIDRTPLMEAVALTHTVSNAIENKDFAKAMELRDPEFKDYYASFQAITTPYEERPLLPVEKVSYLFSNPAIIPGFFVHRS